MRNILIGLLAAGALSFGLAGIALADTDPTVHQVYEAASSGHLDQAQQMMDQVLRDHPNSAKAHYVQSELYAREGKISLARAELDRAEQLEPGLPKENPRSVAELKSELGLTRRAAPSIGATRESAAHFPWLTVVILALVVGLFWMLFRRRTIYGQSPGAVPTVSPGSYGAGGYGPGAPGGGGIGSTVAGGLAGGLAAGAGIVAGEALAHRLLDGGHSNELPAPADDSEPDAANGDMGGADFGVNDPGSWDDSSGGGGGGGGGDDWT
jgi:tetratricopeptide (TPR) repeat protein